MFKKSQSEFDKYKKYILPVIGFEEPIMSHGEGAYVYDVDGNKLLDLSGGQFCTIFGHSNPEFEELFKNMQKIQHTNTATLTLNTLKTYEKLYNIMSDMDPQFITLSTGAEAIEFSMRLAKQMTNKTGLICFDRGYHGLSLGAQAITYGGVYAKPLHNDIFTIPVVEESFSKEDIDNVISQFRNICESSDNIAAAYFEPIVGVAGVYKLSEYFMKQIREICNEFGILLIFDECQSGFGRGGHWFYYQALNVIPDLLVTAKGIGLGFPVSLVAVRRELTEKFGSVTHYSSHQNDPFSSAIIDFGIEYIKKHDLLNQVKENGAYFMNELLKLANRTNIMSVPRGDGLMLGFDLVIDNVEDYRQLGSDFRKAMCHKNMLIQGTNGGKTIRLLPTYEITKEDIDNFIKTLEECLNEFDFGGYGNV